MSVGDAKKTQRQARAYAREHLAECASELLAWRTTGLLADGRVRELAAMLRALDTHEHLQLAEGEIVRAALERVAVPPTAVAGDAAPPPLAALHAALGDPECQSSPDALVARVTALKAERHAYRDMAACMDHLRTELVAAGVIDPSVPPMFYPEAIAAIAHRLTALQSRLEAAPAGTVTSFDTAGWPSILPCAANRCGSSLWSRPDANLSQTTTARELDAHDGHGHLRRAGCLGLGRAADRCGTLPNGVRHRPADGCPPAPHPSQG